MNILHQPLISVVTVSYNAVSTIEETICSVINQTYSNIEYIIIDGGSTDGTVDIIKKYADKIAYWVSEPDKGIYDAMNKGIDVATGEWINFMNSGDTFCNNVLSEIFVAEKSADILYGDAMLKYSWGDIVVAPEQLDKLTYMMPFCHQATFVRAFLLKKHPFDLCFKIAADFHFLYDVSKDVKFEYLPLCIARYEGETGLSALNYKTLYKEFAVIVGKDKVKGWPLNYTMFCGKHYFRQFIKKFIPFPILKMHRQKRLLQNPLIKKSFLKEDKSF